MFLGRKKELQTLMSLYEKDGMNFVVTYVFSG